MEGMGDDVLVHVVGEIVVETLPDVPVDRLQFDEDQRQPVDETDQIGPAVVVGRADAGQLEFAYGEEAVRSRRVVEVDHPGSRFLAVAPGVTVLHTYAVAELAVEIPVVLHRGTVDVKDGQLPQSVIDGGVREPTIQPYQCCAQVAPEQGFSWVGSAQQTFRPEGLPVPGINALPAESTFKVIREGGLHQQIFAVDRGYGHRGRRPALAGLRFIKRRPRRSLAAEGGGPAPARASHCRSQASSLHGIDIGSPR